MASLRDFQESDIPALQSAIDRDTFHPGEWKVKHFVPEPGDAPVMVSVIEDSHGPISFVRYTKTLRISCVWNDAADTSRNARAIILGLRDAALKAKASGFTEIVIRSDSEKLSTFLTKVLRMDKQGNQHYLQV
jgi:hypothetical protein